MYIFLKDEAPAIMMVFELPPRLSLRSHVKTESRYGIKLVRRGCSAPGAVVESSANAEITEPRVTNDLLI
jgi:hypothetical protein